MASDSGSEGLTERAARAIAKSFDDEAGQGTGDEENCRLAAVRVLTVVWPEIYAACQRVREADKFDITTGIVLDDVLAELRKLSGDA